MNVNATETGECKRVLDIEIPAEDVQKEFEKNMGEFQKTAQIRGFRPGKVPRDLILTRFREEILGKTVEEMINKSYEDACKEKNLNPVARAKIDGVEYGPDKPLKYKAEFEIEPELELKKYTKLGGKIEKSEVTEKDVDGVLGDLRERLASFDKLDRASKKGDYIRYEYAKVSVDGKPRSDYRNPAYPVEIGDAKIKEFNKALIGVKAGDNVDVRFTFPSDYEVEEIRGKEAEFSISVLELLEKKLPEADDAFAKKIGQYENLDAMRTRIREDLLETRVRQARKKAQEEIIDKIIGKNEVVVPDSRVERYAANLAEQMKKYGRVNGPADSPEEIRKIADRELKKAKILDWVSKSENIKALPEEVDERIKKHVESHGGNFEETKEKFRRDGTSLMIRSEIREEKTLDWLVENNV